MGEHHVVAHAGQLVEPVVKQHVPHEIQRVALHHLHVSESIERVGGFVETSTVAIHVYPIVQELHIARQNLRAGMPVLVVGKIVRVQQDDLLLGLLARRLLLLGPRRDIKPKQA